MDRYGELLKIWCDSLLKRQLRGYGAPHDGGFLCDACTVLHGRADNAIFPMVYLYAETGEKQYLDSARQLLEFRRRLTQGDGSVYNDGQNFWKATTVFSAIGLYKTLHYCAACLPEELRHELEALLSQNAQWIYENLRIGYASNINYYAAGAAALAACGSYFDRPDYRALAHTLLDYCMQRFTANGLLAGEGQPHDETTPKGCKAIDIGYDMEESVPCLVAAAQELKQKKVLSALAEHTEKMLAFLLPDGGWDNSFGSRNNKWTYYGSRTSDGCLEALLTLAPYNPVFYEAARRCVDQYERCTVDGLLAGGPHYGRLEQAACVHHTICHAAGLADALCRGLSETMPAGQLPCDETRTRVQYFEELDTYRISIGKWLATVTGYDYRTTTYTEGAAHASGGSLSLLYHREYGPVLAGSTYAYRLTEPLNMQQPHGERRHSSLLMRLEYEDNGEHYTTAVDPQSTIRVNHMDNTVIAFVTAHFVKPDSWQRDAAGRTAKLVYTFTEDSVQIAVRVSPGSTAVRLLLPVIEDTATVTADRPYQKEPIYYLSGGFAAEEYRFDAVEQLRIELR